MGGNRHEFMAEPLEMGGELTELSRKILMNQQDPQIQPMRSVHSPWPLFSDDLDFAQGGCEINSVASR